jgi:hypothetical protein
MSNSKYKNQLIPPPELAPSMPDDSTPAQRVAAWVDLMNASEQFVLAGLRRDVGKEGDLSTAYRAWYARQMEEHDQTVAHMLTELRRREKRNAG